MVKSDLLKTLTTIINQSLHTGIFPDKLKIAKVIPLFKKGDPTLIENYRPISLLPAISKIFERVIFNQMNAYFTLNNLFYDKQYGFRKYPSTELAALNVVDTIVNHMDNGNTPFAVYLDLSKAFDTLNHSILLDKLKFYGFRGTSINLIKHYLSNRKQCVEIDRLRSFYINISTGVPQGSILGTLLFIIYMNDLPNASRLFKCIIYADDTTLIANLNDFYAKHDSGLNINILNDELEKRSYWLLVNKLSLNKLKSKFMLFHQPQKRVTIPKLKINNTLIECVDEFNYLGLIINKHLKWNSHVNIIGNKISQTIGVINKLKHLIPQKILLTIYNSLILPHINYCILAWGHDSNRISKLKKKTIRIIVKGSFYTHSDPIFKKFNILKVNDIHLHRQLTFYFKLINKILPANFYDFNLALNSDIHDYNTRGGNKLRNANFKHEFARNCIRNQMPHLLNTTHLSILEKVLTHSLKGFWTIY